MNRDYTLCQIIKIQNELKKKKEDKKKRNKRKEKNKKKRGQQKYEDIEDIYSIKKYVKQNKLKNEIDIILKRELNKKTNF